ncbi:MAG: radical SAM protein, partial [Cyclobacteriaceae bacterium]
MSKVLIANAYWYRLDPKQWAASQPYPPLGTLWAAAVLRNQGEMVSLHDTGLRRDPNEIAGDLNSIRPDIFVVYDDGFNYLTKMCLTVMREAAFVMIRHAHAMGIPVIVCSSDATDHDSLYFGQGADHVIHGEGEQTLMELVQCLKTGTDAGTVAGHSFVRDGKIHRTAPRLVMRDLDHLPMPAWDLVDIAPYRKIWLGSHRYFSLNLATTRGCPYKCNWCAKPIYGNRYNSRSPEKVAQEIAYLIDHFQPDHFWMADDIFGLKPGWIRQFQQACEDRKLKFRYKIQSRADLLEEPGTVEALALSGAETVWMGAESGSQKVLDAMDKGITVEQIRSSTIQLRSRGIRVGYFLQFGYPGETRSDIQSTLDLLSDLEPDEIGISVSYPLPGTVFYERVKSELKQKQNWSDSDDLSLMYRSTFSTAYYKAL